LFCLNVQMVPNLRQLLVILAGGFLGSKFVAGVIFGLAITLSSGCVVHMYDGAKRSPEKIALIARKDVVLESVNGKKNTVGSAFPLAVIPGEVKLELKLNVYTGVSYLTSDKPVVVYFMAEAGKKYLLKPLRTGDLWFPLVVEEPELNVVSYANPKEK